MDPADCADAPAARGRLDHAGGPQMFKPYRDHRVPAGGLRGMSVPREPSSPWNAVRTLRRDAAAGLVAPGSGSLFSSPSSFAFPASPLTSSEYLLPFTGPHPCPWALPGPMVNANGSGSFGALGELHLMSAA